MTEPSATTNDTRAKVYGRIATAVILAYICIQVFLSSADFQKNYARYSRGFDQMATTVQTTQAYMEILLGQYNSFYPKGYREVNRRPPLVFYFGALNMIIFGASFSNMALANCWFFIALILAVYILGARRAGAPGGFIAVGMLLFAKAFAVYTLTWNTDLGGVATVAWTMVILDDPKFLKSPTRWVLLWAMLLFGYFTRITYALFIMLPILFMFTTHLKYSWTANGRKGLIRALGIWGILWLFLNLAAKIWPHSYVLFNELPMEMELAKTAYQPFHTLQGVVFYQDWLHYLGPVFITAGLLGLIWGMVFQRGKTWLPALWFILPAMGFAYYAVNATRMLLPAFPALAVAVALPFANANRRIRLVCAGLAVVVGLGTFMNYTKDQRTIDVPGFGSGYAKYSTRDLTIVDELKNKEGAVVLIDSIERRIISLFMFPSAMVLEDVDRPFFWILFDNQIVHTKETMDLLAPKLQQVTTLIVRAPISTPFKWDHDIWKEFWSTFRSVGAEDDDVIYCIEIIDQLVSRIQDKTPVRENVYRYGSDDFKLQVFDLTNTPPSETQPN